MYNVSVCSVAIAIIYSYNLPFYHAQSIAIYSYDYIASGEILASIKLMNACLKIAFMAIMIINIT